MIKDKRLHRLDATRLQVKNAQGVDATLFATEAIPVETAAVDELLSLLTLQETLERIVDEAPDFFERPPELTKVAITPDFHKAAGIPVGTVIATRGFLIPQAVGNDINCGMRLHMTSLDAEHVLANRDALETRCRHLFFEGGRNIPLSRLQREALFTEGLPGLWNALPKTQNEGLWKFFHRRDAENDLSRIQNHGGLHANRIADLEDFLGPSDGISRDSQIGSIGGGNHFVEFQRVEKILDGQTAHAWGLRVGQVTVMVHTGSVGIGHLCGAAYRNAVQQLFPKTLQHPSNGLFVLPEGEQHCAVFDLFWDALHNAANFAFANRFLLALMAQQALEETCGVNDEYPLLYDAPHNFVWNIKDDNDTPLFLHRKGACPANGYAAMTGTPYAYTGEPVLVPGSMGASSYLLAGQGNSDSLWSASHGAGRALSRGDAMKHSEADFIAFLSRFRVVTPVDFRRSDLRGRRDIIEQKMLEIKQEAPFAYKGIGPIVDTLTQANMARPVAELTPLMTIKG